MTFSSFRRVLRRLLHRGYRIVLLCDELDLAVDNPRLDEVIGDMADELREEVELVRGASHAFDADAYLRGEQTPVFFGSAINAFGVRELLKGFVEWAPAPRPRAAIERQVNPDEEAFSGFIFKIVSNYHCIIC